MDMIETLAKELSIGRQQAESAVRLLDEDNTIPFIARYRKEVTGGLDDTVLRALEESSSVTAATASQFSTCAACKNAGKRCSPSFRQAGSSMSSS